MKLNTFKAFLIIFLIISMSLLEVHSKVKRNKSFSHSKKIKSRFNLESLKNIF